MQEKASDIAAAASSISAAAIEAKLNKALKGMKLAIKYKKIIDKCQCGSKDLLNSAAGDDEE